MARLPRLIRPTRRTCRPHSMRSCRPASIRWRCSALLRSIRGSMGDFRAGGLLDRGLLTLRQREIVIDRTCALNGCEYEWGVDIAFFAAKVKFTPEQIAATVHGSNAEWAEDERVLLDVCEELDATRSISDDFVGAADPPFFMRRDTRNHRAGRLLSNRVALCQCIEVARANRCASRRRRSRNDNIIS